MRKRTSRKTRNRKGKRRRSRQSRKYRGGMPLTELDAQGFVTTPGQATIVTYKDASDPYSVPYFMGSNEARALRTHDQTNMP
jgi:hypothetical protein